ncbi:hypothetical protein RND64_04585 [Gordonia sp. w5E2]|uniref:hypothetical protein n=1 Tax=Gordonia sp. w5E2 TaxID=3075837 RepID=UPI002F41FFA1
MTGTTYDALMKSRSAALAGAVALMFVVGGCGGVDAAATDAATTDSGMSSTEQRLREKRVKRVCEQSVQQQLKDPDSAQFRNETAEPETERGAKWSVTGEVNANNSFGGKVGYVMFTCTATYADNGDTEGRAVILEN